MSSPKDTKKRALITGAANGLGKSLALRMANAGYDVIAADFDHDGLLRLHHDIVTDLRTMELDFSKRDALDYACEKICANGPYDRVFLSAGISATGPFEDIPIDKHRDVMSVNLYAPMMMANQLATKGAMKDRSRLVFISSLSHVTGYPGAASYAATKDALAIYAKSIRGPFRRLGIHVMCVFPGPIKTDHAERYSPDNASDKNRMEPSVLAKKIVRAAARRKKVYYPGIPAKLARIANAIAPVWLTGKIRQTLFQKLDRVRT